MITDSLPISIKNLIRASESLNAFAFASSLGPEGSLVLQDGRKLVDSVSVERALTKALRVIRSVKVHIDQHESKKKRQLFRGGFSITTLEGETQETAFQLSMDASSQVTSINVVLAEEKPH